MVDKQIGNASYDDLINTIQPKVKSAGTGTGNATLTVASSTKFSIDNLDTLNSLTFTIGSITVTVAPDSSFCDNFSDFTSVSIVATGSYNYVIGG